MLDVAAAAPSALEHGLRQIEASNAAEHRNIALEIVRSLDAAESVWRELEPGCATTPFQTFDWHRQQQASAACRQQPIIAIGRAAGGAPLFILPLALKRQGHVQNLVWLSSRQASYCGGLFGRDAAAMLDGPGVGWLLARIAEAVPEADALTLLNQRDDDANPLRLLPAIAGADQGYTITLAPWDELYHSRGNRRTRHNDRRRERRLTELAPWQARIVTSQRERKQLMRTMFAQKRVWLRDRGISDFLADAAVRSLLLDLASSSSVAFEPVIATLDVAGKNIAVSFGLTQGNCHYSLITSIDPDRTFHPYSPGDILFRHVLKSMCESGIDRFDLGIGTTLPKVQYSDHQFRLFHTLAPLTVQGRIHVAVQRCQLEVKRLVKETPPLLALFQRARAMRGRVHGIIECKDS